MSHIPSLNVNAVPFVPVKNMKPPQFGAIGNEKKKIAESEKKIAALEDQVKQSIYHIDGLRKTLNSLEMSYNSVQEENTKLKKCIDTLNGQFMKEKEDMIKQKNDTVSMISKMWCEQIVNSMLKNAFFGIHHPEIMMIKNEILNNNTNMSQQIIVRLFEIIGNVVPFSPFMSMVPFK